MNVGRFLDTWSNYDRGSDMNGENDQPYCLRHCMLVSHDLHISAI